MVINAIRWIQKTGAPWRDLPQRFGPWETIYSRFRRWRKQGIWQQILDALKRLGPGRLKQNRRLATRYEKLGVNFETMWIIGFIIMWL